jgi:hypothetical protein
VIAGLFDQGNETNAGSATISAFIGIGLPLSLHSSDKEGGGLRATRDEADDTDARAA